MSESHAAQAIDCKCSDCFLTLNAPRAGRQLRDSAVKLEIIKQLALTHSPGLTYSQILRYVRSNLPCFQISEFDEFLFELVAFDYVRRFDAVRSHNGGKKGCEWEETHYAISKDGRAFIFFLLGKEQAETQGFDGPSEDPEKEVLRNFWSYEHDGYVDLTLEQLEDRTCEPNHTKILDSLLKKGLVICKQRGLPKVKYYCPTLKGIEVAEGKARS